MTKNSSEIKKQLGGNDRHKHFDELLGLEGRKFLLKHGKVHEANTGEILCHENQIGDTLFVILQGEVEITKESDEKSKVLGKLGAGELFGEISALLSMPRIATVVVNKPSIILEIKINDFVKLLEQVPNLKDMVFKRLSERSIQTTIQTRTTDESKN
jgi:CRP-like cAMP-binding protein